MDPFEDAFENIGEDFETLMPTKPVTVISVDPDPDTALVTAEDVPAMKRSRRRFPVGVGGGEVGGDVCRFVFRASRCEFTVKSGDRIVEADGTGWLVDERGAELIAFGALWVCQVSRERG